ncbi:MAG: hypothetical protein H0V93_05945 [Euzebyales bacterium]|nr:hypothetical protein [Euzebyales bacterium]
MSAIELVASEPMPPRLDRAAVEAARLVRAAREQLLADAGAVTVAMLAEGRGSNVNAARQWLHRKRKAGRLLTVDHDGEILIPTFQLDDAFDLHALASETVAELVAAGLSAWAVWRWFYAHNGWVDARPADLVAAGDRERLERAVGGLLSAA